MHTQIMYLRVSIHACNLHMNLACTATHAGVPSDDCQRGVRVNVPVLGPTVPRRQAQKAPLLGSGFVYVVDPWISNWILL